VQAWVARNPLAYAPNKKQKNYDVAPGVQIKVGIVDQGSWTGTSMAQPLKAAQMGCLIHLARRLFPTLTKNEIADKVIAIAYRTDLDLGYASSGKYTPEEEQCLQGYGRIQIGAAYESLMKEEPEEPKYGAVVGEVYESGNYDQKITGAALTLDGRTTNSNLNGLYGFSLVEQGSYSLRCDAEGYEPARFGVTVIAGKTTTVDFALRKKTTEETPLLVLMQRDDGSVEHFEAQRKVRIEVSK